MPFVFVLGVAQDGGHPQLGCTRSCCADLPPVSGHLPAALAIVDPQSGKRWLVDATPALPEQLSRLDAVAPRSASGGNPVDGIFLTHAHMGHYTGLMYLGREVLGTRGVPLFVQPRMGEYLSHNGPWQQLVDIGNVVLDVGTTWKLTETIRVEAISVPHRDEYSETVAFIVRGPSHSILWLPDIDRWDTWYRKLEDVIATVDAAWIDGTFWADGELLRDMAEVPHPRISATLARLAALPLKERAKVRFVHLNHTNPAYRADSEQAAAVRTAGMAIATEGEKFAL